MLGRVSPVIAAVLLCLVAPMWAQMVDCACETAPLPPLWAKLNGKPIDVADVSADKLAKVAELQKQVIDFRKGELDILINSRLLEMQAAKENLTFDQLLAREVEAKSKQPTDAEVEAYFNTNRAGLESQVGRVLTLAEAKGQIRDYLRDQNTQSRAKEYAGQLRAAYGVKILATEAPPPKTAADLQKVLAMIGTVAIRSDDVERALRPLIYSTQQQVYRIRKDAIDQFVNDTLLQAEATRRGVTPRAVLETEITSKIPVVTESQAQAFYEQNKARLNGDFPTLKYQIIEYMKQQEEQKLEDAFVLRLRANAKVEFFLPEPVAPTYAINVAERPAMGPATAPVTIVAFVDFQCPTCAEFHETLLRVLKESNGNARLVFKNFPLNQHKDARKAAEAAEAAREQGKYWEYAALLYKSQADLSVEHLKALATTAGLDRTKFDAALDSGKYAGVVERDSREGDAIGVSATPSIFINGRPTDAYDHESLKKVVEAAAKP